MDSHLCFPISLAESFRSYLFSPLSSGSFIPRSIFLNDPARVLPAAPDEETPAHHGKLRLLATVPVVICFFDVDRCSL